MIDAEKKQNSALYAMYRNSLRKSEGESAFYRYSNRYPYCGKGDINTYTLFAELGLAVISPAGLIGLVVPTGIVTDDTTKEFFGHLVATNSLISFYGFENEQMLFIGLMHNFKFGLITVGGRLIGSSDIDIAFSLWNTNELQDNNRRITLTKDILYLVNPNTHTCPLFRSKDEADATIKVYRHVPVLFDENRTTQHWEVSFIRQFDMTNDSSLFLSIDHEIMKGATPTGNRYVNGEKRYMPLYEAKMVFQYDHRYASAMHSKTGGVRGSSEYTTDDQHSDPCYSVQPRFWVDSKDIDVEHSVKLWHVVLRAITGSVVNLRTTIATVMPQTAVGNTLYIVDIKNATAREQSCFVANLNSIILDFIARQKLGGTSLNYFILYQLPIIAKERYREIGVNGQSWEKWISERVLKLVYTSEDLCEYAVQVDYRGSPFRWSETERYIIMRELDVAYAFLYRINREELVVVLDHFRSLNKIEMTKYGEYRTKRVILEIYDEMKVAMEEGVAYRTRLDPPPAGERVAHSGERTH